MTVKIKVDGKTIEAEAGRQLIDVLNENGWSTPHFCYHPGLGPDGNCRMCQVEIVTPRGPLLAISCNTKVADGMEVLTDSEKVKRVRAGVEEFLLLNHPLDCPICDKAGECTLQNYYMAHDQKSGRQEFVRFKSRKAIDIGPTLILDRERCVLCDRCVRFLRNWAGEEQLYIAGRGHGAYLTTFPGKEVTSAYSLNTVDLCPVGALTSKDFRFSTPTWFLKRTPSVCTTCSRGCAIEVDVDARDNRVKRLRPRHNPHVNGYWMCDEGRLNYKFVNTDRVSECSVQRSGEKVVALLENAILEAARLIGPGSAPQKKDAIAEPAGPGKNPLVILASATCTLEEMFACKMLAAVRPDTSLYVVRHVRDGVEDHLLRKSDRHPNVKGAALLGLRVVDIMPGAASGAPAGVTIPKNATLFALGFDYGIERPLEEIFEKFSRIVVIAARASRLTAMAHVLIPGFTFAEKDGLVVNFEGRAQKLVPALDRLWDKVPPWEVVARTAAALGGGDRFDSIAGLRKRIADTETVFSGADPNAVGPTGIALEKKPG